MKLHRWSDIKNRGMSPERIARSDERVARDALAIGLRELRKTAGLTQVQLAKRAALSQSQLSRLEKSRNVELRTLLRYVEAAGAHLVMTAVLKKKKILLAG